jgi:hypothetical protein
MTTERRRIKLFPGLLPVGVGVVLLAIALAVAQSTRQFIREAASAPGVVTDLNAGSSHPQIEFNTAAGEKVSYPQGGCVSHKPGDRVRVLYRPSRPAQSDATLDEPGALWDSAAFLGLMGLVFILGGVGAILRPDLIQLRAGRF